MVTGRIEVTLDDATMGHEASPGTYYQASLQFMKAVEILANSGEVVVAPLGLLASQCLELALKAYLLKTGMKEEDFLPRNGGVGHSLVDAWSLCTGRGLPLVPDPPLWVQQLHGGHDRPFMFRYSQENTGIVLPEKAALLRDLRGVVAAVMRTLDP